VSRHRAGPTCACLIYTITLQHPCSNTYGTRSSGEQSNLPEATQHESDKLGLESGPSGSKASLFLPHHAAFTGWGGTSRAHLSQALGLQRPFLEVPCPGVAPTSSGFLHRQKSDYPQNRAGSSPCPLPSLCPSFRDGGPCHLPLSSKLNASVFVWPETLPEGSFLGIHAEGPWPRPGAQQRGPPKE